MSGIAGAIFIGSGFFYHGGIDDILYYGYYVAARIVSVVL